MPLPQHIRERHHFPDLKGRIIDIPGKDGGIWMVDPLGNVLARGFTLKLQNITTVQPNEALAPVEMANLQVTKVKEDGGRQTYKVVQPLQKFAESFHVVLREAVGADAEFDEKDQYDKLLLLVLAASDNLSANFAPTYDTPNWTDKKGWYHMGRLICSAPVEISREIPTESGERLYRLRVPRSSETPDGNDPVMAALHGYNVSANPEAYAPGYHYVTCTWEDLLSGKYVFPGNAVTVREPVQAAMAMLNRWESLAEGQKTAQANEEYTQPERDAKAERDRQFVVGHESHTAIPLRFTGQRQSFTSRTTSRTDGTLKRS